MTCRSTILGAGIYPLLGLRYTLVILDSKARIHTVAFIHHSGFDIRSLFPIQKPKFIQFPSKRHGKDFENRMQIRRVRGAIKYNFFSPKVSQSCFIPLIMPNKSDQHSIKSTKSSSASTDSSPPLTISRKAASLGKAVKKGANAIAKPFKKVKWSLSTRTLSSTAGDLDNNSNTPNSPSRTSSPDPDEIIELSDGEINPEKALRESI
jgi:hypothetical protein